MSFDAKARKTTLRSGGWRLFALLVALYCSPYAAANTSVFANAGTACTSGSLCIALSDFGLLTGASNTFTTNGGTTWNGGVGIQTGGRLSMTAGNTTVNDIVDFADNITRTNPASNTCGTNNLCGTGTLNGVSVPSTTLPVTNNSLLTTAATQLTNIEAWLASFNTSTYNVAAPTSGTFNIETSAFSAGSNVYVYRTAGTSAYSTSNTLTFNCGGGATGSTKCSDDLLVIVLSTTNTVTFNRNIVLGDGLTSDQVLFYIPSSSGISLTNGGTANSTIALSGDFFFKNTETVTIGGSTSRNLTLNGRVFGGNVTDSNAGTFVQNDLGQITPEPGTWASLAGGVGGLIFLHRRRARRKARG